MEESAAAADVEAALGLSPQLFVDMVLDISAEAFEYCVQLRSLREAAAPGVLGASTAAQKVEELQRGLNAIRHVVKDALDKRMTYWVKYCLQHCFSIPEGFMVSEDDNSCSKESHKDGTSDSDLDVKLDSLRRKLEIANKESENLQREISSFERQTTCKRKLDSAIAEIPKLFEDKLVQEKFEDLAKAMPLLQQKIVIMNKKRTHTGSLIDQQIWNTNGLGDSKHQASGCTAHAEDIQQTTNILQNK